MHFNSSNIPHKLKNPYFLKQYVMHYYCYNKMKSSNLDKQARIAAIIAARKDPNLKSSTRDDLKHLESDFLNYFSGNKNNIGTTTLLPSAI